LTQNGARRPPNPSVNCHLQFCSGFKWFLPCKGVNSPFFHVFQGYLASILLRSNSLQIHKSSPFNCRKQSPGNCFNRCLYRATKQTHKHIHVSCNSMVVCS
jgi:hypothetical protein